MNKGNRIFNIETMNVDTLRTTGSIDSLITNLQSNDIDIARIQATHDDRSDYIEREVYTIPPIREANDEVINNKPIKAGVAIIIKQNGKTISRRKIFYQIYRDKT